MLKPLFNFTSSTHPLMLFQGGSKLYGTFTDKSDTDINGVFIPRKEDALGINPLKETLVFKTAGDHGNTSSDTDITLHSLRKLMVLVLNGNPTAIEYLFATPDYQDPLWTEFRSNLVDFTSKSQLRGFLGYAKAQYLRFIGERGQKNVHRPEEKTHGYDCKYAMHAIRLIEEGLEYAGSGKITLPRPNASYLLEIKSGKFSKNEITEKMGADVAVLEEALKYSQLPDVPDKSGVNKAVVNAYMTSYLGT